MSSGSEPDKSSAGSANRAVDEANALTTLVSALAPLDQTARIRLLRTVSTFFELTGTDVYPESLIPRSKPAVESERPSAAQPSFSEDRTLSPKAFMIEKRPQQDTERIACLAYYLTHYRDQPTFKTLDLSKLNTEAAQIKLSNPTRAVDSATVAHFLIPAGGGTKQLSAIGELYVQALPDRSAAKEAVATLKKRRTRVKPKNGNGDEAGPDSESEEQVFDGGSDGAS